MAEARKEADRKGKEVTLENDIDKIKAEKQEAMDAANAQIKAQEKLLAQEKEARAEKAKEFQQQQEAIAEEQANIARREELYNREMRDRQAAAAQNKKDADDALKSEQDKQAQRQKSTQDYITQLQEQQSEYQHNAEEAEYSAQREIDSVKKKIAETEKPYEDQKKMLTDTQTQIEDLAAAQKAKDDAEIEQAKGQQDRAQKALDAWRDQNKEAGIEADYADAVNKAHKDTKKLIDETIPSQQQQADTTRTTADNTKLLADALRNDLGPAQRDLANTTSSDMQGVIDEWKKTFGVHVEDGDIWRLLFARDLTGFHFSLNAMTHLALGGYGYRGVWLQEFDTLFTELQGKTTDALPTLKESMGQLADAMGSEFKARLDTSLTGFTIHIPVSYDPETNGNGGGNNPPPDGTNGRATGGDVWAGKAYWVHKDEMFVPGMDGMVVPRGAADGFASGYAAATAFMAGSGGGMSTFMQQIITLAPQFVIQGGDLASHGRDSSFWEPYATALAEALRRQQVWRGGVVPN